MNGFSRSGGRRGGDLGAVGLLAAAEAGQGGAGIEPAEAALEFAQFRLPRLKILPQQGGAARLLLMGLARPFGLEPGLVEREAAALRQVEGRVEPGGQGFALAFEG
ncbi:MAG: hypothetical protein LDL25_03595, partial [Hyphomicrobiales bacterium]|nr:hypothetical protein [Hyphomicrobiales bacterium]